MNRKSCDRLSRRTEIGTQLGTCGAHLSLGLAVATLIWISAAAARPDTDANRLTAMRAASPVSALAKPCPPGHFVRRVEELAAWTVANSRYESFKRLPSFIFLPRSTINYVAFNLTDIGYTGQDAVQALYLDQVVVLPEDFDLERDAYIIVHELVHHLQREAGAKFECHGAREREAYDVQIKFVDESGTGEKPDPLWMAIALNCHENLF